MISDAVAGGGSGDLQSPVSALAFSHDGSRLVVGAGEAIAVVVLETLQETVLRDKVWLQAQELAQRHATYADSSAYHGRAVSAAGSTVATLTESGAAVRAAGALAREVTGVAESAESAWARLCARAVALVGCGAGVGASLASSTAGGGLTSGVAFGIHAPSQWPLGWGQWGRMQRDCAQGADEAQRALALWWGQYGHLDPHASAYTASAAAENVSSSSAALGNSSSETLTLPGALTLHDLCRSAGALDRCWRWWVAPGWRPPRTVFAGRGSSDCVWAQRALTPGNVMVPQDEQDQDDEEDENNNDDELYKSKRGCYASNNSNRNEGNEGDGDDDEDYYYNELENNNKFKRGFYDNNSNNTTNSDIVVEWALPPASLSSDPSAWPSRSSHSQSAQGHSADSKARASLPPRSRRCGQRGAITALALSSSTPHSHSGGGGVGPGDGGVLLAAGSLGDAVCVYDLRVGAAVALLRCFDRPASAANSLRANGAASADVGCGDGHGVGPRVRARGVTAVKWAGPWRLAAGFRYPGLRGSTSNTHGHGHDQGNCEQQGVEVWDVRQMRRPLCALPRQHNGCQRIGFDVDATGRWLVSGTGASAGVSVSAGVRGATAETASDAQSESQPASSGVQARDVGGSGGVLVWDLDGVDAVVAAHSSPSDVAAMNTASEASALSQRAYSSSNGRKKGKHGHSHLNSNSNDSYSNNYSTHGDMVAAYFGSSTNLNAPVCDSLSASVTGERHCNSSSDCGYDASKLSSLAPLCFVPNDRRDKDANSNAHDGCSRSQHCGSRPCAGVVTGAVALHPRFDPVAMPVVLTGTGTRVVGSAWDSDGDSSDSESGNDCNVPACDVSVSQQDRSGNDQAPNECQLTNALPRASNNVSARSDCEHSGIGGAEAVWIHGLKMLTLLSNNKTLNSLFDDDDDDSE